MLGNWVKETTTTSGTGDVTLAGAVTGYTTFNKQFGDATTNTPARPFKYVIQDGNNWETGTGYLSTTTNLKRSVVEATYSGTTLTRFGSALSLSGGTSNVFCDTTADWGFVEYVYGAALTQGVPFKRNGEHSEAVPTTANYLLIWQMFMPLSGVYSGIRHHCATSGGGTKFQWGIYSISPADGKPGNLVCRTADITPGTGDVTTSFTANAYIHAGWHWVAWSGDGNPTFTGNTVYGGQEHLSVNTDGAPLITYDAALHNPLDATGGSWTYSGSSASRPPWLELIRTV